MNATALLESSPPLFSYRRYWASCFDPAPFLPMSRTEMDTLGWDSCDVIIVTGDAYIDHPSFGMALVGRLLEAQGFRVGIISQPDWRSPDAFRALGRPNLYFGVTSGNMDSMVNRYTAERRIRSDDAYTPNGEPHRRPDRATTVYSQRCKQAYEGVPVIIGSIEASLRRIAHYDYWSDQVRRSVLMDAKADMLLFGNAERALVALTHRMAAGESIRQIRNLRGTAFRLAHQEKPHEDWLVQDASEVDTGAVNISTAMLGQKSKHLLAQSAANISENPYENTSKNISAHISKIFSKNSTANITGNTLNISEKNPESFSDKIPEQGSINIAANPSTHIDAGISTNNDHNKNNKANVLPQSSPTEKRAQRQRQAIRLPAFEVVKDDKLAYAHTSRILHLESNPGNARALVQQHGGSDVWINPPPIPLTTEEMDGVYDLPYARAPHPHYHGQPIPAWEMIRFSVNIMRGCFGGCTFCSITEHEGRIIQSRSSTSILREIEQIRDHTEGFTGTISDLGGPTANMWRLACKHPEIESACRRLSCVYPTICDNLNTDQAPLASLYRQARAVPGIKRIAIGSGVRYDLAVRSPEYVKELVTHHVGGYLKIAPEHTESGPLSKMMKPELDSYDAFKELFERYSKEAGKQQYLIPYFIAAHPGTTDSDMLNLALWLKKYQFRLDQVQTFLPSPMALATAMYHSGYNPLKRLTRHGKNEDVFIARGGRQRHLHKAFLRYHDPENWPILREALRRMGRADLIGRGAQHLVPPYQAVPIAPRSPKSAATDAKSAGTKSTEQTQRRFPKSPRKLPSNSRASNSGK